MRGMALNRPQRMFLSRSAGAQVITPEPPASETWTTSYVTATTSTTYVEDGSDPYNEDLTYGHIACDLTGMAEDDIIVIFCPWVSQNGASLPSYLGELENADAVYLNWMSAYLACFGVKKLTAADLASPPQVPVAGNIGSNAYVRTWAYRGPGSGVIKETPITNDGVTTLTFSGFMKNANHRGLMSLIFCRDGPSSDPTQPSGHTSRARITTNNLTLEAADLLDGSYDEASFQWTGASSLYSRFGAVVEFVK